MKKVLKIVAITLASLLVVLALVISIAVWFIFTPGKLTPIVREQAGRFLTCRSNIGSVELTFFSTFPNFGLKVTDIGLFNAVEGAQSDTLLFADKLVAVVNITAWLENNDVIIDEIILKKADINLYTDSAGRTNFDVFATSSETKEDTTAFSIDKLFHSARLTKLELTDVKLSYIDRQQKLTARVENMQTALSAFLENGKAEAALTADLSGVSLNYDNEAYLNDASLKFNIPLELSIANQQVALHGAKIGLNGLEIGIDGSVENNILNGDIHTDLNFTLDKWQIKKVQGMVPPQFLSALEGVDMDGVVSLKGNISGIYNKERMPLVNASLKLGNGTVKYTGFPLPLHDVLADLELQSDLKTDSLSYLRINTFEAKTPDSEITVSGEVSHLLSDMQCDFKAALKVVLSEFQPMVPRDLKIEMKGRTEGTINAKFAMSQIENKDFAQMHIQGKLGLIGLKVNYDTLNVNLNKASVGFSIPNVSPGVNKDNRFMSMTLICDDLVMKQGRSIEASAKGTNLKVATSDLLKINALSYLNCDFKFDKLSANLDGMGSVDALHPFGSIGVCANLNDTTSIPTLNCSFGMDNLAAVMDTIAVHVKNPDGKFSLRGNKNNQPEIAIDYKNTSLTARMGDQRFKAGHLSINTDLLYDKTQENMLLQWNPNGAVSLENSWVGMPGVRGGIRIPVIKFDFSPEKYIINDSRILIGRSDFGLVGELKNLTSYFRGDSLLIGNFKFNSNSTDVYSLMNLTSGLGGEEEVAVVTEDSVVTPTGPFMVPQGISINLETHIDRAFFENDTARNIRGKVILNDGVLVLDNMNFVTDAAKMQLTAMYKSPRKNHLFVGMDFHMMDVEISELLAMIPDIDSIMPMLRSFGGKGEFHMAVETNMDSLYNLKKSTLLGSASVKGEDLVLMDGETFSEIAKMLRFNKKTSNKVDSLSAEFTIFEDEIDVYPFLIVMDKYKAVVGGQHNLDMNFNYHISLIDSPLPIRLGVNVFGNLDHMKFRLAKCRYSKLYRPVSRKSVDTSQLKLREMIRGALLRKVKKEN